MDCFRHYDVGAVNGEVILLSNGCLYGKRQGKEAAGMSTSLACKYVRQKLWHFGFGHVTTCVFEILLGSN